MKQLSYDQWVAEYKPILDKHEQPKEYWGEELRGEEFNKAWAEKRIWTRIGEGSDIVIVPGFRFVNRMEHFVTQIPWESEEIEVD